jgi:hypothetical protein
MDGAFWGNLAFLGIHWWYFMMIKEIRYFT